MKPELSIVILSYNVRSLLADCLESIFKDPESKNWQVIVVDNASEDDTVAWMRENHRVVDQKVSPRQKLNSRRDLKKQLIELVISKTNLGFSAGNNLGVKYIQAPYTLFLNPDTVLPVGTIPYVLKYLKMHKDVGTATCKVLLPNGRLDDGCHRGFPTPWNSFCHFSGLEKLSRLSFLRKLSLMKIFTGYNLGHLDLSTAHEIDSLTGAFMMMPTKVGEEVGWWDEDYFWNGDDLDFCYRMKEAGYKVMYLSEVQITHFKGSSGGYKSSSHGRKAVSKEVKLKTAKASTEAMRIFYEKHYLDKYPAVVNWITLGGIKLMEKIRISKHNGITTGLFSE